MEQNFWKKCSSCKTEIGYSSKYYSCSVSTCNQKRTGLAFCSVPCFERHLPGARHKDAYALEEHSPSKSESQQLASTGGGTRRIVTAKPNVAQSSELSPTTKEVLIVASKLKSYIKQRADMNTSADVMSALSDIVRSASDGAIENARKEGRKTVMARDF